MRADQTFHRRVRIKGEPDNVIGWKIEIQDIETGEMITNICKAVITLIPGELNMVEFTYYEEDQADHLILQNGQPVFGEIKLNFPEIDLIALERLQKERSKNDLT